MNELADKKVFYPLIFEHLKHDNQDDSKSEFNQYFKDRIKKLKDLFEKYEDIPNLFKQSKIDEKNE